MCLVCIWIFTVLQTLSFYSKYVFPEIEWLKTILFPDTKISGFLMCLVCIWIFTVLQTLSSYSKDVFCNPQRRNILHRGEGNQNIRGEEPSIN
jgi:hypothetical protein